jgi:hypothetical protein
MAKKILMAIAGFIVAVCILPVFLSSKFSMARSTQINQPLSVVFSRLTDLNEYVKWNPFPEGDPTNQEIVTGTGVGSYMTWKGEKTGEGKMTIAGVEPDRNVLVKMEFFKPMHGEGIVQFITSAKGDSVTELTWTFEQDLTYFNRYFGLFMDAMMGKHFEKGLVNFKGLMEQPR